MRRLILLAIMLLLVASPTWAVVQYTCVYPTGSALPTDRAYTGYYTNLVTWEAGEDANLMSGGTVHVCEIVNGTTTFWSESGVSDIAGTCDFVGWATGATCTLTVTTVGTARHDGTWYGNPNAYVKGGDTAIRVRVNNGAEYTTLDGLRSAWESTASSSENQIFIYNISNPAEVTVKNCIIRGGDPTGTPDASRGIALYTTKGGNGTSVFAVNNVVLDCIWGIASWYSYLEAYNNTIYHCAVGFSRQGENPVAVNNCVTGTVTAGFSAGWNVGRSYNNASGDASAPACTVGGGVSYWRNMTFNFVDSEASNFHINSPMSTPQDLIGQGIDMSGVSPFVSTDIDGDARGAAWDIGADEYVSGAPAAAPPQRRGKVTLSSLLDRLLDWLTPKAWAWRTDND